MKKYYFILFALSLLMAISCKKEKCFEGTVHDSKTGQPIAGARVTIPFEFYEGGSQKHGSETGTTDDAGRFEFCVELDIFQSYGPEVFAAGYSNVIQQQDYDILMTPLDGLVKVNITNQTGAHDTIYVSLFNNCEFLDFRYFGLTPTMPNPLVLQQGETHTQTFSSCIGDTTAVQWRFTKAFPWTNADSFLVTQSDTILYNLNY